MYLIFYLFFCHIESEMELMLIFRWTVLPFLFEMWMHLFENLQISKVLAFLRYPLSDTNQKITKLAQGFYLGAEDVAWTNYKIKHIVPGDSICALFIPYLEVTNYHPKKVTCRLAFCCFLLVWFRDRAWWTQSPKAFPICGQFKRCL